MSPRGVAPLRIVGIGAVVVIVLGGSYGGYVLNTTLAATKSELASTTAARATLAQTLEQSRTDNEQLAEKLALELAKNGTFESQIAEIAGTVGTLTKLSKTDKELLQKYSRVYFLNENYIPSELAPIDPSYTLDTARVYQVHTKVRPFLENMLTDAQDANVPMFVLSSYRSFAAQAALKSSYKVTYGTGSNRFSADQGYSEHQLGTAVDLTTKEVNGTSLAFAKAPAGVWLGENAYKYGFILSYPSGNTYYQYEPWHWRFVGVTLATKLHDENKRFYDLPQRDIDTYLASIFD
jgi:D-alanyl-D-alanine carboxypeptidase